MRESRTYGSGRGACHEMHVPTATSGASSSRCSAARRRVAARGARAAGGADATHRRADGPSRGRSGSAGPHRRVPAGAAATWAGPIGRNVRIDYRWAAGDAERIRTIRGRTGRARTRRHPGRWRFARVGAAAAGDPHRADRVHGWCPIRSAPASSRAWRGRAATSPGFTPYEYGMSGKWLELLKADRAARDASGGPSGCRDTRRDRPVRRDPGHGAVARGGGEPDRRARRRRDRARHPGVRAAVEWRPDRAAERVGGGSSRSDQSTLAARHRLPAIYSDRFFVTGGGLIVLWT